MVKLKPDSKTGIEPSRDLSHNVKKAITSFRDNILVATTVSIVAFLSHVLHFSFNGVYISALSPEATSALTVLVGLPLFGRVLFKAAKSSNPVISRIFTKNRTLISLVIAPYIIYIAYKIPFQLGRLPMLTGQYIVAYFVIILSYIVYVFVRSYLPQKANFLSELLNAAIPAAFLTTGLLVLVNIIATQLM